MSSSVEPPTLPGLHRWCRSLDRRQVILSMLGNCLQAPAAAPVAAPVSSSVEPPTLSHPIKVLRPNLALGNYPPGPDDVASKSVSGPDTSLGAASHPQSWALVDKFRHSALCKIFPFSSLCLFVFQAGSLTHAGCLSSWAFWHVMRGIAASGTAGALPAFNCPCVACLFLLRVSGGTRSKKHATLRPLKRRPCALPHLLREFPVIHC